jgi:hypothetical protein
MVDAHAYRWSQIADELCERGHNVDVISSIIDSKSMEVHFSSLSIKRVGGKRATVLNSEASIGNRSLANRSLIVKGLKSFFLRFYSFVYWPDPLWHWLPYLLIQLIKIRKERYDVIISYYPCLSAHIGAYVYKLISVNKDVRWIADYGDPFSVSNEWPPNNYRIYRKLNLFAERKIYKKCDLFVVMNYETWNRYFEVLKDFSKLIVVPHMAPRLTSNYERLYGEIIILRYIGSFHKKVRNHFLLFELANRLKESSNLNFVIELYGPADYWEGIEVPSNVQIKGLVSRKKALELLSKADFVLNIENTTSLMTPSKVIECISSCRPLINIGSGDVTYGPVDRYSKLGMVFDIKSGQTKFDLVKFEDFIHKSLMRKPLTDDEIRFSLEGHMIDDIISAYNLFSIQ